MQIAHHFRLSGADMRHVRRQSLAIADAVLVTFLITIAAFYVGYAWLALS